MTIPIYTLCRRAPTGGSMLSIILHARPRDLGSRSSLTYANDGERATRDLHEQVWWDNNMLHRTAAITGSVIALSWSALPTPLFGFIYLFVSPQSGGAACLWGGEDVELCYATDRMEFTFNARRFVFWLEVRLLRMDRYLLASVRGTYVQIQPKDKIGKSSEIKGKEVILKLERQKQKCNRSTKQTNTVFKMKFIFQVSTIVLSLKRTVQSKGLMEPSEVCAAIHFTSAIRHS